MPPKGQELDQASRRLPRTMEPTQKYSCRAHGKRKESEPDLVNEIRKDTSLRTVETHESEDKNSARRVESSDKVNGDTALLVEMENCQPEVRPSGASPNLTCESNPISNITYEPVEAINPRDSSRIPQGSTEGSPQGTDQSYTWSFEEILESVISEFPKINLKEGEEGPSCCIAKEETSTNTIEESSESSDSSEFRHKTNEPVSVRTNPLFRRKSKMASNGHPKNSRPPQPNGNMSQAGNNQEELRHKQRTNNMNPFANYNPSVNQQTVNSNQGFQNAQSNHPQNNIQGKNNSGGIPNMPNFNTGSSGTPQQSQGMGSNGFQACPNGQGPTNATWGTHTPNWGSNNSMPPNGGNQNPFCENPSLNCNSQRRMPNCGDLSWFQYQCLSKH
eukprot:Gb_37529 [translate_table: standard]